MRLVASLTALTLVFALASCDSSTTSNSNSSLSLVGNWEFLSSDSFDSTIKTSAGTDSTVTITDVFSITSTFANNGVLTTTIISGSAGYGPVHGGIDTTLTGNWKVISNQLYQTNSDGLDTSTYVISGDTLKETGHDSSGKDTTYIFIHRGLYD